MTERQQINCPDLCKKHSWLLVSQCGYGPDDTWRALIIVAQIALFQAATTDARIQKKLAGDIQGITKLGCLACQKPDAFGEIVEAGKSHDLGRIKTLGEKWVLDGAKKEEDNGER